MAASSDAALRSGIFVRAISSTCCFVTLPTLFLFGMPEPFCRPAALSRRIDAGGVLVMKVKERSEKTVITTGMISPCCPCVRALNALQNSMMLTPCWPNAGPTGGAGLAAPAGTWSLISVRTLRAIWLDLLHLVETDFDRSLTAKDRHKDAQLAGVVHDFRDLAREIGERSGDHLDRFADRELGARTRALGLLALEKAVDLAL